MTTETEGFASRAEFKLELALHNRVYEDIATKFFEHFLYIAKAMTHIGDQSIGLWHEEDGFFYDVLRFPNGDMTSLKVRSMVGLIPFYAVEIIEPEMLERLPDFKRRLHWFLSHRPELSKLVSHWNEPGRGNRCLLSLLRGHRMKELLRRMLDETEFLSDYGVRSLSHAHLDIPCTLTVEEKAGRIRTQLARGSPMNDQQMRRLLDFIARSKVKQF